MSNDSLRSEWKHQVKQMLEKERMKRQPLIESIKRGEITEEVKSGLIEMNTNEVGRALITEIIQIACHNHHHLVAPILSFVPDLDLNRTFTPDSTPVVISAAGSSVEVMRMIIENGGKVNTTDKIGNQPIHIACKLPTTEMVEYLVSKGAFINSLSDTSPLMIATHQGNLNLVKYLVEHGAIVNTKDFTLETPLFCACKQGETEIVQYLLENGADMNITCAKKNYTPLYIAAAKGYLKIVEILLERGANPHTSTNSLRTPLNAACGSNIQVCLNQTIMDHLIIN